MLKINQFLLLICLLSSSMAMAQWTPTANLSIFSEDGEKFFLILNGEKYNDVAQTNIRVEELPNPYYNCKVIFEDKSLPTISKNALMLADADGVMQDVTYRIKKDNKGKPVLRFFSFVPAQQNMLRPANCATYRFGNPNALIAGPGYVGGATTTTTIQQTTMNPATNVNVNIGAVGMNMNIATPNMSSNVTTTTTTTTTSSSGYTDDTYIDDGYRRNNNNRHNQNNNHRGACNTAMSSGNFNEAKATIAKNGFDETRLSTAKQIISSNCLSTNQIVALLATFSFEESKLDFAKYAYEYCTDRNNYFKVSNAFSFESSKTELNDYVQSMR